MKLKISYSVITIWLRGDINGVIEALNGHWSKPNEYMQYGIEKHKEWELEVIQTGRLPKVFGGNMEQEPLKNFRVEQYKRVQLLDWLWLSGIIDLQEGENGEIITDYKTGRGRASSYVNSLQVPIYHILSPEAKIFRFLCYNQYDETVTSSFVHLTNKSMDIGIEKVVSIACDIRATLEQLGMGDFDNVTKKQKEETEDEKAKTN